MVEGLEKQINKARNINEGYLLKFITSNINIAANSKETHLSLVFHTTANSYKEVTISEKFDKSAETLATFLHSTQSLGAETSICANLQTSQINVKSSRPGKFPEPRVPFNNNIY